MYFFFPLVFQVLISKAGLSTALFPRLGFNGNIENLGQRGTLFSRSLAVVLRLVPWTHATNFHQLLSSFPHCLPCSLLRKLSHFVLSPPYKLWLDGKKNDKFLYSSSHQEEACLASPLELGWLCNLLYLKEGEGSKVVWILTLYLNSPFLDCCHQVNKPRLDCWKRDQV